MPGPDLPDPHEPFDINAWQHRWPSGTHQAELFAGVLVFSGEFDHRDVEIAQRAYRGRQIVLNDGDGIEIHPASDTPPRSIFETFAERIAQQPEDSPPG